MTYELDPEIATVLAAVLEQSADLPVVERGDWKTLRERGNIGQAYLASLVPASPDVQLASFSTMTQDSTPIELRWYTRKDADPGSAVVYVHGGGMILGNLDVYDAVVSAYVTATGVPFLSVNYRLAPEVHDTTLAEDAFAGVSWLIAHASQLRVDPYRIAIMGDSGGGGVAAGAAIVARERQVALAQQILIYPMLDDRNLVPNPLLAPFATWTYEQNETAWNAVLDGKQGSETVSPIAAPARLTDFGGLAPAYIEVGDLDIFRDEDISYAKLLARAGVPVELHVHPRAPHGFERFAPNSKVAKRAMNDRVRVIQSL
jgi:acetyl esterase/lipase